MLNYLITITTIENSIIYKNTINIPHVVYSTCGIFITFHHFQLIYFPIKRDRLGGYVMLHNIVDPRGLEPRTDYL